MRVLCVAAHPDDEVLGVGATLAKHALAGDEVRVLILGTGALARTGTGEADVASLGRSAMFVADVLRVETFLAAFPDNRFDTVPLLDIIRVIESRIASLRPEVVYTHSSADLNVDHRITHDAVRVACRPVAGCTVQRLLAFETPSATEWGAGTFSPSVFVDVAGPPWARKMEALGRYHSEMRPAPHPRSFNSIAALAQWRGSMAGLALAEAFELIREVR